MCVVGEKDERSDVRLWPNPPLNIGVGRTSKSALKLGNPGGHCAIVGGDRLLAGDGRRLSWRGYRVVGSIDEEYRTGGQGRGIYTISGAAAPDLRWQLNWNYGLQGAPRLSQRVDSTSRTLRMTKRSNLTHVELMIKDARGIAISINHELGCVQYRLSGARVWIFGCDDRETPGSHVLEKPIILARSCVRTVPPCENGMQKSVRTEVGWIV